MGETGGFWKKSILHLWGSVLFEVMRKGLWTVIVAGLSIVMAVSANAGFKSLGSVDSFVDKGKWELHVRGKDPVPVEFDGNHTLPEDKAITLGNKKYRFWSVAKHPTMKDQYVLRVHLPYGAAM